jgi:hypothetical protein
MAVDPYPDRARRLGAVAGLVPAGAAVVLLAILGASPSREAAAWLGGITVVAIVDGWLIGPRLTGSFPSDLRPAVVYAVVGSLAYLVAGTTISIVAGPVIGDDIAGGLAWRVAGQLAYGALYLPFVTGVLTPFGLLWVIVVHGFRRHAGHSLGPAVSPAARTVPFGMHRDPRRLGVLAAVLIAAYGLFVAVLPYLLYDEPRSPWAAYRPVALFILFAIPAAIALIGALTRQRSLLVAAGLVCLLQSYVSFSLVTLGFMVPALLLLTLGGGGAWPAVARETRRSVAAAVVVIVVTLGAWVATLGMTEEVCWSATRAPDGGLTYERVRVADVMTVPPGGFASGCDGGTLTAEGMGVGAVLAVGAVSIAAASTWARRDAIEPA